MAEVVLVIGGGELGIEGILVEQDFQVLLVEVSTSMFPLSESSVTLEFG